MADIGLEDELSCPICLELYQDPVSLPCQHNFCRECLDIHLQQHIDTSTGTEFHCPSCRCSFELKNQQVATLPKNVVLANIVGRLQSRKVETTWTEAGLRRGNQSEACKVHRKPLSVFCDTCDQVICTKCLTDHRGHHTQDLEDKVISCMDEVKMSVLPKISKLKNSLASTQQDLIVCQSSVEEEVSTDWQEVMDAFSMLRSVLNRKELELKSNLQTRKEKISSHFKTELQKIDSQLDSLKQFESQVMTVTQQCPASETYLPDFNQYGKIHKDLAQLESELYRPSPVGPRYKGDPHTASSKQHIKDSLLRITHDLDKMEVSKIARGLDKMEVSRIACDLDKMEVSRIARDPDKMEVSRIAHDPDKMEVSINKKPGQDITLHKAGDAWKPHKSVEKLEDPEDKKTEILYKKARDILDKLTPQNFQTLVKQMSELEIDTEERLKGVTDLAFEKAVSEPMYSVVYASMCRYLAMIKVPSKTKPGELVNFHAILLTRCQKEFENDTEQEMKMTWKEIKEAKEEEKGKLKADLEFEEYKARKRSSGNIRFVGELFKLKMLTENIMHDCVFKLLKAKDLESLECLCCLLTTIGKELDSEKAKPRMEQYFQQMRKISLDKKTPSRVRFMLQDVIELRMNRWVPRRDENNPKTLDQIHKEAQREDQERRFLTQQPGHQRGGVGYSGGASKDKKEITVFGEKDDVHSVTKKVYRLLHESASDHTPKKYVPTDRSKHGTPHYWQELYENPPTPQYWKHFKSGYSLMDYARMSFNRPSRMEIIQVDPTTFGFVKSLVEKTFNRSLVGKGNDAVGLSHSQLVVRKVERIENYALYEGYAHQRRRLFKHKSRGKSKCMPLEATSQQRQGAIQTSKHIDSHLLSDMFKDINEHYFFHGTDDDRISRIAENGLDPRYEGKNGMFGQGIYAVECSTKADQYADTAQSRQKSGRKMLMMRLLLGDMYVTSEPYKYSLPPCKTCNKEKCLTHKYTYNSVVADGQWLFREFVVYDKNQCYPEYIITYDRQ